MYGSRAAWNASLRRHRRRWAHAAIGGGLAAAAVFIPTDLIDTPWFTRMTPPTWWGYVLGTVTVGLTALAAGLGGRARDDSALSERPASSALASSAPVGPVPAVGAVALAVGCPLCNKIIVLMLGVGGALDVWSPLQPVLGALAVLLLGVVVILRWQVLRRGCRACVPLEVLGDLGETALTGSSRPSGLYVAND